MTGIEVSWSPRRLEGDSRHRAGRGGAGAARATTARALWSGLESRRLLLAMVATIGWPRRPRCPGPQSAMVERGLPRQSARWLALEIPAERFWAESGRAARAGKRGASRRPSGGRLAAGRRIRCGTSRRAQRGRSIIRTVVTALYWAFGGCRTPELAPVLAPGDPGAPGDRGAATEAEPSCWTRRHRWRPPLLDAAASSTRPSWKRSPSCRARSVESGTFPVRFEGYATPGTSTS